MKNYITSQYLSKTKQIFFLKTCFRPFLHFFQTFLATKLLKLEVLFFNTLACIIHCSPITLSKSFSREGGGRFTPYRDSLLLNKTSGGFKSPCEATPLSTSPHDTCTITPGVVCL